MQTQKKDITIAVFCGGSGLGAASDLRIINADIGVAYDVDLELVGANLDKTRTVRPIPLAVGHSVGSMTEKFETDSRYAKVCRILRDRPGDLTQGLAQTPVLGAMAFDDLGDDLFTIGQRLLTDVRTLTNGSPERIKLLLIGSNSGGTSRGMRRKAARHLTRVLHESTEAVVNVQDVVLGALTYMGLGDYILANNAVGLQEDIANVLDPDHMVREVRSMMGFELPIHLGDSKSQRDAYMKLFLQALFARQTQEKLGRRDVNASVTGAFGRMNSVQAGFWWLDSLVNPAGCAAISYAPIFHRLITESPEKMAKMPEVQVTVSVRSPYTPDKEKFLQLAVVKGSQLPEDWRVRFIQARFESQATVSVKFVGDFVDVGSVFSEGVPKSVQAYRERRQKQQALLEVLEQEHLKAEETESDLRMQYESLVEGITQRVEILFPMRLFWDKFKALVANRGKLILQLSGLLEELPQVEEQYIKAKAQHEALRNAIELVKRTENELNKHVERVHQWLRTLSARDGIIPGLFEFAEVDEFFGELINSAIANDEFRFGGVVAGSIVGVSRGGIARILGEDEGDILNLARALMQMPQDITPMWGGKTLRSKPRSFVVIPPVHSDLFGQLQQALVDLGSQLQLTQMDTVAGGVGIVRLDVFYVEKITDIVTRQYEKDLKDAKTLGLEIFAKIPGNVGEEALRALLRRITRSKEGKSKAKRSRSHKLNYKRTTVSSGMKIARSQSKKSTKKGKK